MLEEEGGEGEMVQSYSALFVDVRTNCRVCLHTVLAR